MDFIEALKIIGYLLLALVGFLALNLLGYWQATRDMTPEEKERFHKYIEENGFFGGDDDTWPL